MSDTPSGSGSATVKLQLRSGPAVTTPNTVPPDEIVTEAPASAVPLNAGVLVAMIAPSDGTEIDGTAGATVSTVQADSAGDQSTFPAPSRARTATVCGPSASEA